MRVLLDIALLGAGVDPARRYMRGGIHRVVEDTAVALGTVPDVAVRLCASTGWEAAKTVVESHPVLSTIPFPVSARKQLSDQLRRRVEAERARGAPSAAVLPWRVARRVAHEVNRLLDVRSGGDGSSLDARTVADADVYHSPVSTPPPIVRRTPRLRRFVTIYDLIPVLFPEMCMESTKIWFRELLDGLHEEDWVLAISQRTKDDLLNVHPIAPERVVVVPLAADPQRFYRCDDAARRASVRRRYGVPDAPYVLSVGTLEPRKNIPHLIRSFGQLVRAERLDDLHLVLTGAKGWDYDQIFAQAGEVRELRDRIVFTGYVDDDDLAPLYSGALVFVYPSLYEGFGLPPLEAMRCGTPVITSNTSSLPEVVGDGGIMVDPHDADALAGAMLHLYRDSAARADLAARAVARAGRFSWEAFAARTGEAYRAAL
jgi:glycosyltransferase involved in cell wall biosynthesis